MFQREVSNDPNILGGFIEEISCPSVYLVFIRFVKVRITFKVPIWA